MYTLVFARDLGVDPASERARNAIDLVRSNVTWGPGFGDSPFFEGEVEPCINGRVVALGAYFGVRSDALAFPTLWHYDVLRALDYLREAGAEPDARSEEAIAIVLDRRQVDGRWLLDVRHRDTLHDEMAGDVGAPNRWVTLRVLRVLEWWARRG
jgi:hypothetical protein